ncbi:hypothetical protein WCE55_05040 [Luteimonas sp. MJ293]|uniref:hypothetical protein n=1 Tax=Luteimonas sp. MJ146 TaxID=3129240 RepID=UPI0031BA5C06
MSGKISGRTTRIVGSLIRSQALRASVSVASWPRPNNAFKPKLHRYASHMADKACHVPGYALQFGLT